ncbi:ATP synthase F1 subunit delta [Thalassoroseus pseudoceratinae]|uniref:ATP synthase F1 subunit delta n=1 Tax=Thalassoroseus pseudoceratinae TaxID=2713176 RepID=UPI0014227E59|nr:ATP synthase F1 subunit delta [Thalassoroseus pseudoceratinae]
MQDPSAQAVAKVYANALLGAADGDQILEEGQSFVDDVLDKNPAFRDLLFSTVVNQDDKLGFIERVVAPRSTPLFANFLRVLVRNQRMELLPLVMKMAAIENNRLHGRQPVVIRTARALTDEQHQQIQDQLRSRLPFEPMLEVEIQPELLGGLIIQIGDTVYDSSLRSRMKQLRGRLRQRSHHEIQRARDRFSS